MSDPIDFLIRYPDELRHPIIADCDDWDDVKVTLEWLESDMNDWATVMDNERRLNWMNNMRVLFEALYVAGYFRGREELAEEDRPIV